MPFSGDRERVLDATHECLELLRTRSAHERLLRPASPDVESDLLRPASNTETPAENLLRAVDNVKVGAVGIDLDQTRLSEPSMISHKLGQR